MTKATVWIRVSNAIGNKATLAEQTSTHPTSKKDSAMVSFPNCCIEKMALSIVLILSFSTLVIGEIRTFDDTLEASSLLLYESQVRFSFH